MLVYLAWTFGAFLMLACGWFAGAWVYQRRIELLQIQIRVLRQTATVHADQARRQIGQLQADLAGRAVPAQPWVAPLLPTPMPDTPVLSEPVRPRRRAGVDQRFMHQNDGFPHTAIVGADGFAQTEMLS